MGYGCNHVSSGSVNSQIPSRGITKRHEAQKKGVAKGSLTSRFFPTKAKFSFRVRRNRSSVTTHVSPTFSNHWDVRKRIDTHGRFPIVTEKKEIYLLESNDSVDAILNNTKLVTATTSAYFLRSPASVHGSILSLGPLVYTWIGNTTCQAVQSNCSRRSISSGQVENAACDSCIKTLNEDAFRHFEACPVFRSKMNAYSIVTPKSQTSSNETFRGSCMETVGRWVEEHALRHLCPNQCYLRAFAPRRDWVILHKKLKDHMPIGDVLNDWTCRLIHPDTLFQNQKQDSYSNTLNTVPSLPTHLPQTEFTSTNSDQSFPGFQKFIRSLVRANKTHSDETFVPGKSKQSAIFKLEPNYIESVSSPLGLIEELFPQDPWRLLVCTMLLNKTRRKQNLDGMLFYLFEKWPTAFSVVYDAAINENKVFHFVFALVRPAGLGHSKATAFIKLSKDYVSLLNSKRKDTNGVDMKSTENTLGCNLSRREVKKIFNCGDYAADAYQIFVRNDFESPLLSNDDMLQSYVEWKRSLSNLNGQ